jgi:hypothetical protein
VKARGVEQAITRGIYETFLTELERLAPDGPSLAQALRELQRDAGLDQVPHLVELYRRLADRRP